ncbi:MAG TPA: DUF4388 domain-containing protein [Thermoanaerobaculia bacterium]
MNERTILEGDLAAVALPDVLTFVSMIRRTGKLALRNDAIERTIYWNDGEVAFATSNSPEHSLGQFLVRNGKISQRQYEETRQKLTPGMRHGKLLVQVGFISPKDLWWGVKHQVLEIIYSTFSWKTGHFSFVESDEEVQERITLSMSTSSIIMEGIRRMDEIALIKERIPSPDTAFVKVAGAEPMLAKLEINEHEAQIFHEIDGKKTARDLIRLSDFTEFEVMQILFQFLSARLIEVVPEAKSSRPIFLDVEDSPELLKVISTYNDMFGRLYSALQAAVGELRARDIFTTALQSADSNDELWSGVFFDQDGRFDENMLLANVSELPFEERRAVLDEGLNTLLSIQLFEISQHLDATGKVEVFRFISEQKAQLEKVS